MRAAPALASSGWSWLQLQRLVPLHICRVAMQSDAEGSQHAHSHSQATLQACSFATEIRRACCKTGVQGMSCSADLQGRVILIASEAGVRIIPQAAWRA